MGMGPQSLYVIAFGATKDWVSRDLGSHLTDTLFFAFYTEFNFNLASCSKFENKSFERNKSVRT